MKTLLSILFNKFFEWFKNLLHIYSKKVDEITQPPEEKSISDAPFTTKTSTVSKKEGAVKTTDEMSADIPSILNEKKSQDQFVEKTEAIEATKANGEIIRQEERKPAPQKPYIKKIPTEEKKEGLVKLPTGEKKPSGLKQRKIIFLGDAAGKRRRLTGTQRKSLSDEDIEKEITDKVIEEKEVVTTIEPPYVEINLDSAEVYLILPEQQFKTNDINSTPRQFNYILNINGKQDEVLASITTNNEGLMIVEEKRILLDEPLVKLQLAFPDEIQGREYNYNHDNQELYVFVAIGNNRGRMYYLSDKDRKSNPLPKRVIWVLLHEEFELQTMLGPGDICDERWMWDTYKSFRIDLSNIDTLVIKNRITGEEKSFALQSTFCIEGKQLIEDDFKKECPLFIGKALKIVAPYENPLGWCVWIQNKIAGYRIKENWTGKEPLILDCPEDLPCDYGEFQVDICQLDTRIPDETLFFRLMPCIELNCSKELIIPDPKLGHTLSAISVKLDSNDEWRLENIENREIKVKLRQRNFYEIELPPEKDIFRFTLAKTNRPESILNFQITLPRLKWKTSKQEAWNSRLQKIERKELKPGEPSYLLIRTNDFDNKYELVGILEINSQKLQEGKFIRKGVEYKLELNQFFDTIKHNKDKLVLKAGIRKVKDYKLLGMPEILYFDVEKVACIPPQPEIISYDLIKAISPAKICSGLRKIEAKCQKEKPRCKKIRKIYYSGVKGKKGTVDKKDFMIKSLAFLKFIIDTYGDEAQIKGKSKWRKRIDLLQQKYPEEFNDALIHLTGGKNHAT